MRIREANPSDAAGIARVHVECWRTTYVNIVPDDFLAGLSVEKRTESWTALLTAAGVRFTYVAEDDAGEIIGWASGGPERSGDIKYKGEIYGIYILKPFQRRGLGRKLTTAIARALIRKGIESMLIWVLEKNTATGFYEALGGVRLGESQAAMGGLQLAKVAFGWENLRTITGDAL
jgi:GNAT superfamily N-acetyltransferase